MQKSRNSRKEQAAETKKLLFDTAMQLLEEEDFDNITIRMIVNRANVSIGTFYNYYSTKLDVFYETYIFADEFFETTVRTALASVSSLREKLLLFFDYYAKYSSELTNLKLTRILYNSANKCFDRPSCTGIVPLLNSLIQEGKQQDLIKNDLSAVEITQFLMISMRGQVYHWCTNDGSYNLREAVARHANLLLQIFL